MKIDKCEPFEILIANGVKLTITRVNVQYATAYFEVSTDNYFHGKVYSLTDIDGRVQWKTTDDIHPLFVKQIGHAIDSLQ